MLEHLREIVRNRRAEFIVSGRDFCPHPVKLFHMSRLFLASTNDYQDLAWHLLGCFKCAQRWELLQSDPHLQLLEIWAVATNHLPGGDEGKLLSLRAKLHMQGCQTCREKSQLIERGFAIGKQAIDQWLEPRLVPASRSSTHRSETEIMAQLVDEQEQPILTEAGELSMEQIPMAIACDNHGTLSINLSRIPPEWRRARLILIDTDILVDLCWKNIVDGHATFALSDKPEGIKLSENDVSIILQS